ncbi:FKBP-type peptidyl-prolyl cis-trans isomerase [Micrococcus sp.]|uniref:FKBP-type peptidyl-prolyl cis-trans isomerase n=1 Tax=Micrococcus sp. TaxID=1271 RepID=UPI002A90B6FC|nr:FKBP-type peptidyl-prolyl cis-trans isomerase [Micrococcus sp.]MDY6055404.1 FKBP-type peptidyl-prolyl cis-trans isomerase [Micrococcus sp.]
MDTFDQTPAPGRGAAPRRRRPLTLLSLSLAGVLLATACGTGDGGSDASATDGASATSSADGSAAPAAAKNVGDGEGDPAALEGVHFSQEGDAAPTVRVDPQISTDQPSTRVLATGEGEQVMPGDLVVLDYAAVDPRTGKVTEESFTRDSATVIVNQEMKARAPELYDMLTGLHAGGLIAAYQPGQQVPVPGPTASGSASPSPSSSSIPERLYLYKIQEVKPRTAQGEAVQERDDRLPEVTVDETTGRPSIATPEGQAPDELVVEPLVRGEGREVAAEDSVVVQYTGVKWSDGSVFDSSWDRGEPVDFPLTGVIAGWTEGLQGQRVGSRVLLSVPSEKAYGPQGTPTGSIGPDEDLLFVVDILDAQAPAPQN